MTENWNLRRIFLAKPGRVPRRGVVLVDLVGGYSARRKFFGSLLALFCWPSSFSAINVSLFYVEVIC